MQIAYELKKLKNNYLTNLISWTNNNKSSIIMILNKIKYIPLNCDRCVSDYGIFKWINEFMTPYFDILDKFANEQEPAWNLCQYYHSDDKRFGDDIRFVLSEKKFFDLEEKRMTGGWYIFSIRTKDFIFENSLGITLEIPKIGFELHIYSDGIYFYKDSVRYTNSSFKSGTGNNCNDLGYNSLRLSPINCIGSEKWFTDEMKKNYDNHGKTMKALELIAETMKIPACYEKSTIEKMIGDFFEEKINPN